MYDDSASSIDRVIIGGRASFKPENRFIPPTVLKMKDTECPLMTEELFSPILPVYAVDSYQDGIELMNQREKPLALYVFSEKRREVEDIVFATDSGGVTVNYCVLHVIHSKLYFGGVGQSGMGGYHGKFSFETFSHMKPVVYKTKWPGISLISDIPLLYYPFKSWKLWMARLVMWSVCLKKEDGYFFALDLAGMSPFCSDAMRAFISKICFSTASNSFSCLLLVARFATMSLFISVARQKPLFPSLFQTAQIIAMLFYNFLCRRCNTAFGSIVKRNQRLQTQWTSGTRLSLSSQTGLFFLSLPSILASKRVNGTNNKVFGSGLYHSVQFLDLNIVHDALHHILHRPNRISVRLVIPQSQRLPSSLSPSRSLQNQFSPRFQPSPNAHIWAKGPSSAHSRMAHTSIDPARYWLRFPPTSSKTHSTINPECP